MYRLIVDGLMRLGFGEGWALSVGKIVTFCLAAAITVAAAYLANLIAKRLMLKAIRKLTKRTKTPWDDMLVQRGVFNRVSHLAPALVIYALAGFVGQSPAQVVTIQRAATVYMALVGLLALDALLNALVDIYRTELQQR